MSVDGGGQENTEVVQRGNPIFNPKEIELGDRLWELIKRRSNTGNHNAPIYLGGKFPDGRIPGLRDHKDWQTVVLDQKTFNDPDGAKFMEGLSIDSVALFRPAAIIDAVITDYAAYLTTDTNLVIILPTGDPNQCAISYVGWSDRESIDPTNAKTPNDTTLSLNFVLPTDATEDQLRLLPQNPGLLERVLFRSPYRTMLRSFNQNPRNPGPIVRNQVSNVMLMDLRGSALPNNPSDAATMAIRKKLLARKFPVVRYRTPVGDIRKR